MKSTLPISVLVLVILSHISCLTPHDTFDETKWTNDINAIDMQKLYAVHMHDNVFFNPWLSMPENGFFTFLSWRLFGDKRRYTAEEENHLPKVIHGAVKRIMDSGTEDFFIWIGHNTFLLRIKDEYWIVDPMFSERAFLPSRHIPPALTASDICSLTDRINIIITHNHYDHCDEESIKSLPHAGKTYVPLGLGALLMEWGRSDIIEMDWWQERAHNERLQVICVPSQHWSRRIKQDLNTTLWAGFILHGRDAKYYFPGDSGYFPGFTAICRKYPVIDYVFMPVSVSHPRSLMHYAHMNVDEALQAYMDLKAKYFIPAHWGTFRLGDEPPGYAGLYLDKLVKKRNLDTSRFIISDAGEIIKNRRQ